MSTITILVDNEVSSAELTPAWGFSAIIERPTSGGGASRVLFDVGWDGDLLLDNAKALGICLEGLDALVLSHGHWDHAGGLPRLLRAIERPPARVVVPTSLSPRQRLEIANRGVEVLLGTRGAAIGEGIRSTGTLPSPGGQPAEQALLIDGEKGPVLLTGCAHPGVAALLAASEEKVVGLIGGLHDHDQLDLLAGLDPLIPAHCTRHKRLILESFPQAAAAAAGYRVQI